MIRTKLAATAIAAMALVAGPASAPAAAEDSHICYALFVPPYDQPCVIALQVYCTVFPTHAICR